MNKLFAKNPLTIAFILFIFLFTISGCSSIGNKAGDFFILALLKNYVGENYNKVARISRTADNVEITEIFSPPKVKIIGEKLYSQQLSSGNRFYIHLLPQKQHTSSGFSLGRPSSILNIAAKTTQRFEILAFLVNSQGIIIDYGHGRYNTESSCTSVFSINLVGCDQQQIADVSSEVKNLVKTSSGKPLTSWK